MPTVRITDATVEPVDLARVKRRLALDQDDPFDDEDILALITTARHDCEARLQRTLVQTTWRHTRDAFPGCAIGLEMGPVIAVTSVQYVDTAGVLQTLASTEWQLDAATTPARLVPAYGTSWPATRAEPGAVRITYTAGYGTTAAAVPPPLKDWIVLAVGDLYQQRTRSAERPAVPLNFVDGLLDPYKVWGL